ncbi:UNVERIFIED_CONTAM: Transposon Ty3-G Gag-Pol polyprotein [Sesamum radiatum]|uniref:Transposon Ty3-G Gag-Pol polyprotein n=1 Tax=Sesamum radiatum TaxID=300843 RepID=A0AAW2PHR7_SESRA
MFGVERSQVIKEEVDKLLKAKYIRPVQYPEWMANVVLVPKLNGKWRLCIDFTDLNKACPKNPFPLPRIDVLVDSTSGCEMLSFLDAYQVTIRFLWLRKIKKKQVLSQIKEFSAMMSCISA